jgi:rhomboid-like protein
MVHAAREVCCLLPFRQCIQQLKQTNCAPSDKFTLILLPPDLREILSASGSTFLAVVVIIEFIGLMRPLRIVGSLDHWAHLGGYASGALLGWHWKKRQQEQRMRKRQEGWRRYLAK